ncbi:MAG: hypothetical protein F4Y44_02325 [Chloroflexi bacterium]|nr:hypothetical protein [Chloroflexota bacterium]
MLGIDGYEPAWTPVVDIQKHFDLKLDNISYLNLIPLATVPKQKKNGEKEERLDLKAFSEAYKKSTKHQLTLLNPDKVLFFGSGPHTQFQKWESELDRWDFKHVNRNRGGSIKVERQKFDQIREWLKS